MLRTALLGGNSITLDADLSKYIETVSDQGVIEGLEVSSNSVAPGKAWVKATRSNGETIMTLVQNTEALAVDTSGTKKIWLEIKQEAIDNGALNNEDGTGIAEIKTGPSVPSQNFLLLASVADGQIKDERNLIPKIQSVAQRTDSLEEKITTAEGKIEHLEEAGGNENFSKKGMIGGDYANGDTLYLNRILKIYEAGIGMPVRNTQYEKVYFVGIANGNSFDSLSVPFYRTQNPMDGMICEVRNVVSHEGDEKIKYKPGERVYATGNVLPNSIDLAAKMIEITLNQEVNQEKGTLIAFVLKRISPVDVSNNYILSACSMGDNGSIGINRYMGIKSNGSPVAIGHGVSCLCSGIEQECYTKSKININTLGFNSDFRLNSGASNYIAQQELGNIRVGKYKTIVCVKYSNRSPQGNTFELQLNGVKIKQLPNPTASNNQIFDIGEIEIPTNGTLSIYCKMNASSSGYYLQGYVSMNNVVGDDYEIEYIPEEVSSVGTMQKLLFYGFVKNKRKELYNKKEIAINKTIVVNSDGGSASATWEAPSDGLLELSWVGGGKYDNYYTENKINGKNLTFGRSRGSGGETELKCYGRIFVKKGTVEAYCRKKYTSINPSITLLSFIPL